MTLRERPWASLAADAIHCLSRARPSRRSALEAQSVLDALASQRANRPRRLHLERQHHEIPGQARGQDAQRVKDDEHLAALRVIRSDAS
jgi:hypothetical protein